MSRAVFLNMTEKAVVAHCAAENIGISSIGKVASGRTRLVCMSVNGAAKIREQLKAKVEGDASSERRGPGFGFIARP